MGAEWSADAATLETGTARRAVGVSATRPWSNLRSSQGVLPRTRFAMMGVHSHLIHVCLGHPLFTAPLHLAAHLRLHVIQTKRRP